MKNISNGIKIDGAEEKWFYVNLTIDPPIKFATLKCHKIVAVGKTWTTNIFSI